MAVRPAGHAARLDACSLETFNTGTLAHSAGQRTGPRMREQGKRRLRSQDWWYDCDKPDTTALHSERCLDFAPPREPALGRANVQRRHVWRECHPPDMASLVAKLDHGQVNGVLVSVAGVAPFVTPLVSSRI